MFKRLLNILFFKKKMLEANKRHNERYEKLQEDIKELLLMNVNPEEIAEQLSTDVLNLYVYCDEHNRSIIKATCKIENRNLCNDWIGEQFTKSVIDFRSTKKLITRHSKEEMVKPYVFN